ncbi:MAG: protein kinase [Chloroflexota bacterium]
MSLPEKYGRYQIKRIIGKGGMATVYLAHDPRFGRDVALKAVAPGFNDEPTFQSRFEREARTIAKLEHHAIVPVYDFGEDNGQLFLVMRHMPNGTLSDRIIQGPLNGAQAIPIVRRIADALDHAHQNGVVHRDLKPGNILFDAYERAYLSDFGIVKLAAEGTQADLTGSGVIGTPAYMSPEQIHGDEVIDGRSDIYTLGVILFEMLTGRKPYRADTPVKQMMAHVMEPIPDIAKILPDLPSESIIVLQRALAKQKADRYQKAQDLTADLTSTITGQNFVPIERSQAVVQVDHDSDTISEEFPTLTSISSQNELTIEREVEAEVNDAPPDDQTLASKSKPKSSFPWIAILLLLVVGIAGFFVTHESDIFNRSETPNIVIDAPTAEPTTAPVVTEDVVEAETAVPDEPTAEPPTPTAETPAVDLLPESGSIGRSVEGQPISYERLGDGQNLIVLIGGIHAGIAPASVALVDTLKAELASGPDLAQSDVQIVFIPNLNPDAAEGSLFNSNGVDLDKNWDCDWSPNGGLGNVAASSGGAAPFSEPETAVLQQFLLEQRQATSGEMVVLFFDAPIQTGWVSAGGCGNSAPTSLGYEALFSAASNYLRGDLATIQNLPRTGKGIDWLEANGIPAVMVWLPSADQVDIAPNLEGVLAIMQQLSE